MKYLDVITRNQLNEFYRKRKGEIKWGDVCSCLEGKNWKKELKANKSKFVLLGLPEDIGVRANYGRPGASSAWIPALNNILNMQSNSFLTGSELLILGSINFNDLNEKASLNNQKSEKEINQLRKLVEEVDERVLEVVGEIVKLGKVPIIIGGGHNNAYPNIVGSAKCFKNKTINVINCDAHSDFRALEGRHSGNGFSYAFEQGFIKKYAMVGLHENYNSGSVFDRLEKAKSITYSTFEQIFIREELSFKDAVLNAIRFVKEDYCGVEIDMDTVQNIPSSAKTSSGISANMARQFAYWCGLNLNAVYFHIAEAAPVLSHIKADNKTGKLIAYLVSDFIKGVNSQH
jgi:formiminoglutamase